MRNRFDGDGLTQANEHVTIVVHHVVHLDLKAVVEVRCGRERIAEVLVELIPLRWDGARPHAVVHPAGHEHPSALSAPGVEARVMHGLEHSVLFELDVQVLVPHAR